MAEWRKNFPVEPGSITTDRLRVTLNAETVREKREIDWSDCPLAQLYPTLDTQKERAKALHDGGGAVRLSKDERKKLRRIHTQINKEAAGSAEASAE